MMPASENPSERGGCRRAACSTVQSEPLPTAPVIGRGRRGQSAGAAANVELIRKAYNFRQLEMGAA